MPSARSDLFIYIGVALATTVGLFVLHRWYASYLDVRYHQRLEEGGYAESLLAAREEEQKALSSGKIPLEQAMDALARGAGRAASIAPAPSQDVSAVSGWIHARGFKPATAHPVRAPRAAKPTAAEPAPTGTPDAAVQQPPAAAPSQQPLRLKTEVVRPQTPHQAAP